MIRVALVNESGVVETVAVHDGVSVWAIPDGLTAHTVPEGAPCSPGWTWGDPPRPPLPSADELRERVNAAVDARIEAGWPWRGTVFSASLAAQTRWARLDVRRDELPYPLPAASLDDTTTVWLAGADDVHEGALRCEAHVIAAVAAGAAAKAVLAQVPALAEAVLGALAGGATAAEILALAQP